MVHKWNLTYENSFCFQAFKKCIGPSVGTKSSPRTHFQASVLKSLPWRVDAEKVCLFFSSFFFNCLRLIVADKINFYIPGMGNPFWLTWVNLIFGLPNILCTSNLILKKRAHWVGIKNVQVKKIKNSSLSGTSILVQSWDSLPSCQGHTDSLYVLIWFFF